MVATVKNIVAMLISSILLSCFVIVIGGPRSVTTARVSRDAAWPAAWKQVIDHNNSSSPSSANQAAGSSGGNGSHHDNETTNHEEDEEVERFKVAAFDLDYVRTNLMISIWVLFATIAKFVFHSSKKLEKIFPESCLLIIIGVVLGVILYFSINNHSFQLNVQTFFLILLPPIILDAGYFMPSRSFFDNLGTILLYAVIGTLLNTLWIGFSIWGVDQAGGFGLDKPVELLHCLVFASLLAAVDPVAVLAVFESVHVNEVLHIIVFGESLLNDGISVVLYHMFEGFSEIGQHNIIAVDVISGIASFFVIVFGATGIGIVCGVVAGVLSRFAKHTRVMEPLVVVVIGYMSFLLAEMFHLSGILSCTFCGITMRKYCEVNISQKSQTTIKYLLKMMASVCETIIFMYLGISAVSDLHIWNTSFILLTLLFCLLYRALGVIILTFFANRVRLLRLNKIDQFIMAYGGLRGAIAFALAALLDEHEFPQKHLFVTATVVVIYFTNLIMGSTIKPLVNILKVKKDDKRQLTMNEKIAYRLMDHLMAGIEDLSGQKGHHLLRERFSQFNNKYLKPIIVGRHHPSQKRGYEIFNVYQKLSMKDAKEIVKNPTSATSLSRMQSHIKRMSSMSELDLDQRSSTANLNLFDVTNWCYLNGLSSSMSQLSENTMHANDPMTKNGVCIIDKATGKPKNINASTDNAVFESLDLSYNPERPQPHIYRRHMLSSVSIPRLESIKEASDATSHVITKNPTKPVTHMHNPTILQELSKIPDVSADETIITFHADFEDDLPSDNSPPPQHQDEKHGEASRKRRVGFDSTGAPYEMQEYSSTAGYKYVHDAEIDNGGMVPNSLTGNLTSVEEEPSCGGFINVAYSSDATDPDDQYRAAESSVVRVKGYLPDTKDCVEDDKENYIGMGKSKGALANSAELADGKEANEMVIASSQL